MANWNKITMTDVGAALQAKVNAGLTEIYACGHRIRDTDWRLRQCNRPGKRRTHAGYQQHYPERKYRNIGPDNQQQRYHNGIQNHGNGAFCHGSGRRRNHVRSAYRR